MKRSKLTALSVVAALTFSGLGIPVTAMAVDQEENTTLETLTGAPVADVPVNDSDVVNQPQLRSMNSTNIPIESNPNRPSFDTVQQRILKDTNDARKAVGLEPLKLSTKISTVATNWSQQQADDGVMKHNPAFRTQIPAGAAGAGENVAYGYNHEAVTQKAWIESPGHYRNLTYPEYTHIGIGVGYNEKGLAYYTQVFAIYKFDPDVGPPPVPQKPTTIESHRIAGADRFETSTKVLEQYKNPVNTIYVTTGTNFPDALSVSGIAGKNKEPVVITNRNGLTASQLSNIKRLQPKKVVVIGGEDAVGPAVVSQLKTSVPQATVKRIAGVDRYDTAIKVVNELWVGDLPSVYMTTGANFPDALAAAPAAIKEGGIVLPVAGYSPSPEILKLLDTKNVKNITVVGDSKAVGNEYRRVLIQEGYRLHNLQGTDRYDSANLIAKKAFSGKIDHAYITTGTNFPDALSVAALAGANSAPLLLVSNTCVMKSTRDYIDKAWISKITVIGSASSVSDAVKNNLKVC